MKFTEGIVLGPHGACVAKPVQLVTRSELGTATTHDLQMAEKTALNWAHHVKHSCANRGLHVMVSIICGAALIRPMHKH